MLVIPATWDAEVGESLEPGGGGCSELRLCHCTPAWAIRAKRKTPSKKKKKLPQKDQIKKKKLRDDFFLQVLMGH